MNKEELRKFRKTAGMTQAQMAALIGVHPVTVKRWEAGTSGMRPTSAALIRQLIAREFSHARATARSIPARTRPR